MSQQLHAGEAGRVTPAASVTVQDQLGGFQHDDYRLRAVESQHETQREIVKTRAWAGVCLAVVVAVVFICAMAWGVPLPWELALPLLLGRPPAH